MAKSPTYTDREQEVLDKVDYYRIRVFQNNKNKIGWAESIPFSASEVLPRLQRITAMGYRACLYAVRNFDDGEHLANVTPAYVSAVIELSNVK